MDFERLNRYLSLFAEKTAKVKIKYTEFDDGIVICGDSTSQETFEFVEAYLKKQGVKQVSQILIDPPFLINIGGLKDQGKEKWDKKMVQQEAVDWMFSWTKLWWPLLINRGSFYMFNGVGTYKNRPFFSYLAQAEEREDMNMFLADFITWKKLKGYGSAYKYLFTREELAYFLKSDKNDPIIFNKPYLSDVRNYDGWNKDYPALSKFKRRTNVWADINEIMFGKYHSCQKPIRLLEIPIEVNTKKGQWVLDYFAGSGVTAFACRNLGRKFILIEQDPTNYKNIVSRLKVFKADDPQSSIK